MRTTELFRTCANEYVAAAALACIGGPLERRVAVGPVARICPSAPSWRGW
jgi:hypothetical protein